jgi:hypothetical protein
MIVSDESCQHRYDAADKVIWGASPRAYNHSEFSRAGDFFIWIRCNLLKSPDPAKEKQRNPSFFVWFYLVFLALICIKLALRL